LLVALILQAKAAVTAHGAGSRPGGAKDPKTFNGKALAFD